MKTTVTIAVIKRKSTGQIHFAEQIKDQYTEVSFQIGFVQYGEFMEMKGAKWDKLEEFRYHETETDNFILEFIEKEIEL
jgi:hypothetical protein